MNDALLIPAMVLLATAAVVVIGRVCRDIWREMQSGTGDVEDGTRTERRKNEKLRREIEQWREGR